MRIFRNGKIVNVEYKYYSADFSERGEGGIEDTNYVLFEIFGIGYQKLKSKGEMFRKIYLISSYNKPKRLKKYNDIIVKPVSLVDFRFS